MKQPHPQRCPYLPTDDSLEVRALKTRWKKCSLSELIGADYALRIFRTSPVLRGEGLKICEMLINQVREEINSRPEECKTIVGDCRDIVRKGKCPKQGGSER